MYTLKQKKAYARRMKRHATAAEKKLRPYLWIVGYGFQEYDAAGHLPDFYSKYAGVAIEVDGGVHDRLDVKTMDKLKDARRRGKKNYTMRVSNRYALKAPLIVAGEALLTALIYKGYRTLINVTAYIVRAVRLTK